MIAIKTLALALALCAGSLGIAHAADAPESLIESIQREHDLQFAADPVRKQNIYGVATLTVYVEDCGGRMSDEVRRQAVAIFQSNAPGWFLIARLGVKEARKEFATDAQYCARITESASAFISTLR